MAFLANLVNGRSPSKLIPWLVLVLCLALTLSAWRAAVLNEEHLRLAEFEARAGDITSAISMRMRAYEQVLRGTAGLFAASVSVERDEFHAYVESLRVQSQYPGMLAIGFAHFFPDSERSAYLRRIQAGEFPDYKIQPDGRRAFYAPVLFRESQEPSVRQIIGFDMFAEQTRRAAMEQARDTGNTAATGKVVLLQDQNGVKQAGFLMYTPVYRNGAPTDSVQTRQAVISGFVYATFRANELMQGIIGHDLSDIDYEVFDGVDTLQDALMYVDGSVRRRIGKHFRAAFSLDRVINFNGHAWTIRFFSLPRDDLGTDRDSASLILLGGVLISFLLFGMAWSLQTTRERALGIARDMTQALRESERTLFEEKERAQVTLQSIGDAVVCTDIEGKVTYLNPIAELMTGWPLDEATGRPCAEIVRTVNADTREALPNPIDGVLRADRTVSTIDHVLLLRRSGSETAIEESSGPIHDRHGAVVGAVMVFHDVSEARAMALKMSHLAQHDFLTGLPNRALLLDRIAQAIAIAERHHKRTALMFIDLDRFKQVNDSLGHAIGDMLLQAVAKRLTAAVRRSDTVSRQGGDEFVILLAEIEQPYDAQLVADKLLEIGREPYEVEGNTLRISFSIGIAVCPDDGADAESLTKHADAAMYRAKLRGRDNYKFFAGDMNLQSEAAKIGRIFEQAA